MPTMNNNVTEETEKSPQVAEVTLPGEEIIEAPKYVEPEKTDSIVNIPKFPKNGIQVVATRNGFYNSTRIFTGDKFKLKSEKDYATWFECVDPDLEKDRKEHLREKKKLRKVAKDVQIDTLEAKIKALEIELQKAKSR